MSYLLDTCILSQLRMKVPPKVREWFETKDQDLFLISVVTISELWDGIERLENGKKRKELEDWFFGEVHTRFKDRILPIDNSVAKNWGTLNAKLQRKGICVGVQDLYIAATAISHSLALVTLNMKDFENTSLNLINPWNGLKGMP